MDIKVLLINSSNYVTVYMSDMQMWRCEFMKKKNLMFGESGDVALDDWWINNWLRWHALYNVPVQM